MTGLPPLPIPWTAMNIGEASRASGVSTKMIRHYESVGLLPPAARSESGYRQYTPQEIRQLAFIRQSRELGFPIERIRELLSLWQDRRRPSRLVKALAEAHVRELDEKLRELSAMRATLQHLVDHCAGDERPDCPIIDTLAEPRAPGAPDEACRHHDPRTHLKHGRGVAGRAG